MEKEPYNMEQALDTKEVPKLYGVIFLANRGRNIISKVVKSQMPNENPAEAILNFCVINRLSLSELLKMMREEDSTIN
jgi:hypothetical protein